jgi:RNA methyltransferase, TrmH family
VLSKNQEKSVKLLQQKKHRNETGLFIAEGYKIVDELIRSSIKIRSVYATAKWFGEHPELRSANKKFDLIHVNESELQKISALTTPNEVLAVAEIPENKLRIEELRSSFTIALDEIKDPGNLGTIIRIADWFGIKTIVCSLTSVDAFNPKVVQATMGSFCRVNVIYENLVEWFGKLSVKIPVYGTLLDGENIYKHQLSKEGIILFGNESRGLSKELYPFINHALKVPSFSNMAAPTNHRTAKGEPESLNVAVAAAIVCSEFRSRFF